MSETWGSRLARYATNAAAVLALGLIIGPIVAVALYIYWQDSYHPLRYPSPQHVETDLPRQNGMAVVRQFGAVRVTGQKCNDSNVPLAIAGRSWWVRQSPRTYMPYKQGEAVRQPGCEPLNFENSLSPLLAPGIWRIEGTERTTAPGRTDEVQWYTEWFLVVGEE